MTEHQHDRRTGDRRAPITDKTVVYWGPLAVVLALLVVSFMVGLGTVALVEHNALNRSEARSALRDLQLCQQAAIDRAIEPLLPTQALRDKVDVFLADVDANDPLCRAHPAVVPPRPTPTPSAPKPHRNPGAPIAPVTPPQQAPAGGAPPTRTVTSHPSSSSRPPRRPPHSSSPPTRPPSSHKPTACLVGHTVCLRIPPIVTLSMIGSVVELMRV